MIENGVKAKHIYQTRGLSSAFLHNCANYTFINGDAYGQKRFYIRRMEQA